MEYSTITGDKIQQNYKMELGIKGPRLSPLWSEGLLFLGFLLFFLKSEQQ